MGWNREGKEEEMDRKGYGERKRDGEEEKERGRIKRE